MLNLRMRPFFRMPPDNKHILCMESRRHDFHSHGTKKVMVVCDLSSKFAKWPGIGAESKNGNWRSIVKHPDENGNSR